MSSQKRSREYERRRAEEFQLRIKEKEMTRRKRNRAIGIVLATTVIAVAIFFLVKALADKPSTPDPGITSISQLEDLGDGTQTAVPEVTPTLAANVPDLTLAEGRTWSVTIDTSAGPLTLELDGAAAPQAVASFVTLANEGFFNGTVCHRLVTAGIYVLQCGDPTGTGGGGPEYRFGPVENAPTDDVYPAGTLAMARVGNDGYSMGSQFFIVYEDSSIPSDSAGGYTVFGTVTSGLDVVKTIAEAGTVTGATDGAPAQTVTLLTVSAQ